MELRQLLNGITSPDNGVRQQCEQMLDNWFRQSPLTLLEKCVETLQLAEEPASVSVTAATVLKSAVSYYWGPGFEQFKGTIWDESTKAEYRRSLMQLMETSSSPVLTSVLGSIISKIGSLEYPEQWPDLMDSTMNLLSQESTLAAGLLLLKELFVETIQERDFFKYGNTILDALYRSSESSSCLLLALQCFHECINFFLMGDDEELPALEDIASKYVGLWDVRLCQLLSCAEDEAVLLEVVSLFKDLQSAFPDATAKDVPELFNATFVRLETLDFEEFELASHLIGFLESCLGFKGHKPILRLFADQDNLKRLLNFSIKAAVIPEEHVFLWQDDFNEFLAHELETTSEMWPRQSIASLIGSLKVPELFQSLLISTDEQKTWRDFESCLFLLCAVLSGDAMSFVSLKPEIVKGIRCISDKSAEEPLLQARLVIFSGYVASTLKPAGSDCEQILEIGPYFEAIDENASPILRAASLRSFSVAKSLSPTFRPLQLRLLKIVSSLVESADEETPAFLVEVLGDIVKLNFNIVNEVDSLIDIFFTLVAKDIANIELNVELLSTAEDILDHFAQDTNSLKSVVSKLLTPVLQVLNASSKSGYQYSNELQFALDLANSVFEHSPDMGDTHEFLKLIFDLVTKADDEQVLQSGSFAYVSLLEHAHTSSLDSEVIQQSLGLASRLLSPGLHDRAALASGRLVLYLLTNFSSELGSMITDIIVAAVTRLISAENALLAENLTQVLCKLILQDAKSVIDILSNANLLDQTLKKWLSTFEVIRGADEIFDNVKALIKVYDLGDSRVEAIVVDDEAIAPADMIITRSKAKNLKFTQISLPTKILRILIKELSQNPDIPLNNTNDDEWDDEIDFDANGEARVDYRSWQMILNWFEQLGRNDLSWFQKLPAGDREVLLEVSKMNSAQ